MPKNRNTIGNRTCDLSACSAVLQPTAPLCVPSTCKSTRKYSPKFALKQEVLLWTSAQNVLALLLQKTADSFASYESVPHPWWFVSAMYKAAHNIPTTIILISVSTFTYTSTSWNERDYELWRFSSYGSWELVNEYFLTFHRPTVPASSRSSSPKLVVFRHIKLKKKTVLYIYIYIYIYIYRVSQEKCARLREGVPYVKVYRYNPKHLCPKLNGYRDNGQRSLKLWQLLHTYGLPNTY